jgi:tetratricopeptide (TPR) repeat protein
MTSNSGPAGLEAQVRRNWDEAQSCLRRKQFPQALAALETCRDLLASTGLVHSQYSVWFEIGRLQEEFGRFAAARPAFAEALVRAERLGDVALQARACHRLGHMERLAGRPEEALRWFERSAVHAQANGDARGVALSRAMIGQIVCTEGQAEAGLRQMLQALAQLPVDAPEYGHLVEHTAYFGLRVEEATFVQLVNERIADQALRDRLRGQRTAKQMPGDRTEKESNFID